MENEKTMGPLQTGKEQMTVNREQEHTRAYWESPEYMAVIMECRELGLNPTELLQAAIRAKIDGFSFLKVDPPISSDRYTGPITELMFIKEGDEIKTRVIMDPNL